MIENKKDFYTVKELADILKISRIAVFNKIKKGQVPAHKVGRNFIILKKNIAELLEESLSDKIKKEIDAGVNRVVREYGETLKLLGKE
jgi:excisionase family DNA binding protein